MAKLNVQLILIDDQNDFTNPNGNLYVKGGEENVGRIAKMIDRLAPKIDDITLTMDSHRIVDISHPQWWTDENGKSPAPFTMITAQDMRDGKWTTRKLGAKDRTLAYLNALEATKRYPHVVWPEHCLIGDEGHNIHPTLAAAVHGWERTRYAMPTVVTKGSNPWTEHFSAVRAEVPDPKDPGTQINRGFIDTIENADMVLWGGEARSHCLANTFRDTIEGFSNPDHIKKMVLLTDATSDVPSFEALGEAFVREMTAKGMRTSKTTDILV